MTRDAAGGLIFVIATGARDATETDEARRIVARLLAAAGVTSTDAQAARCELPGILWGWVPFPPGAEPPGDRLTHASQGRREAVLRGDPVWMEPRSGLRCDAGMLLELWESEGPRAAASLDNLSLAVVADAEAGELTVVTDRMGGVPVYVAQVGGSRVLCTSYLALSRLVERKTIDGESLAAFFHLGYFPGRKTAFRDVRVLAFASRTRIRGGFLETEPYWQPAIHPGSVQPLEERLDGVVQAFNAAVREYSAGRSRMHLAMTAGLDSRTVASSLVRQGIPFETYTHGFPGCWEGKRVESIVRRHGIPHRFVPLVESFTSRLGELAHESFRFTEGTISCIEKSHLIHVLSLLREDADPGAALLLGGGAGMLKGTFYRLLHDEDPFTAAGVDRYISWNFAKKLPDIFASEVPAGGKDALRAFVKESLDEAGRGTFFQRLDYLYAVRYRRWAGGVKHIYRRFFPVREPFVSARLLDTLFSLDPAVKSAHIPHFTILSSNRPALQYDLTNKMTPALPFNWRTFHRFLPSIGWRAKQLIRGFSRRYLPREIFPLADYVDYKTWIRGESGRRLVEDLLDPGTMKSCRLYDEPRLRQWLAKEREEGYGSFSLIDKMCTLELFFREVEKP